MHFIRGFTYLHTGGIVRKGSYPNIQYTTRTVSYLEGDWVITLIQLHQITE